MKFKVFFFIIISLIILVITQDNLSKIKKNKAIDEADLYLPEVSYLKFISLGFDGLISDLILAKALTYYGSHYYQRNSFKYIHLKKLFFTAVEMDPFNKDAFIMGNNILKTVDPSSRSSIEILKRGAFYHPDYWKFPEMIGFNYYYSLDEPEIAGKYYEIASKKYKPSIKNTSKQQGPAPYVISLSSKFYEESGKYREALRVLKKFYDTTTDKRLKKNFLDSYRRVLKRIDLRGKYVNENLYRIEQFINIQLGTF